MISNLHIMNTIENIQRIRSEKRLSQAEMAEKLGMAQNNYGKIERGITELTVERLYKIAEILGTTPVELLGFENSKLEEKEEIKETKNLKDEINRLEKLLSDSHLISNFHGDLYSGIFKIIDDTLEKVFEKIILKLLSSERHIGKVKIRNKGSLQELTYQDYLAEIGKSEDWSSIKMIELILTPEEINILLNIIFESSTGYESYANGFFANFVFGLVGNNHYKSQSKYLKHFEYS